jgi:DNA-binding transcriptional LysR family regulator
MARRKSQRAGAMAELVERRAIPPFAAVRAFEAVGRLGGVRRAAEELGVDHAVVSRHLKNLEAWLGTPLFDRSGFSPRLNPIGVTYLEAVSSALTVIARSSREVRRHGSVKRLLIWCVPGFASRWLAPNLEDFTRANPGFEVELRPTDVSPHFGADEADGDIRFVRDISTFTPPPGVSVLRFARPHVFPVASPDWIAANARIDRPEDLLDLKLLHEENDEEWRAWFAANKVALTTPLQGPKLWHAHMTLDAARRGQGVSLANAFLVGDDIKEGRLAPVLTSPAAYQVSIGDYVFSARADAMKRGDHERFHTWLTERTKRFLAG